MMITFLDNLLWFGIGLGDNDKWFARHPPLGFISFEKMVLNDLKDTRDDDKWFARVDTPLRVSYCLGRLGRW